MAEKMSKTWLGVLLITIVLLILIVRISEMSVRMRTFEEYIGSH
jgi:hypothetical protein